MGKAKIVHEFPLAPDDPEDAVAALVYDDGQPALRWPDGSETKINCEFGTELARLAAELEQEKSAHEYESGLLEQSLADRDRLAARVEKLELDLAIQGEIKGTIAEWNEALAAAEAKGAREALTPLLEFDKKYKLRQAVEGLLQDGNFDPSDELSQTASLGDWQRLIAALPLPAEGESDG